MAGDTLQQISLFFLFVAGCIAATAAADSSPRDMKLHIWRIAVIAIAFLAAIRA